MRLAAALVLVCAVGCAPRPYRSIYFRTAPRAIDVDKRASEPVLEVSARRLDAERVELTVKWSSDVHLTRTVHYGAAAVDYLPRFGVAYQAAEVVMGVFYALVTGPVVIWSPGRSQDTEHRRVVTHLNPVLAYVHPGMSPFVHRIRFDPVSDAKLFADQPHVREYGVRLPASEVRLRYRALDASEAVVASGEVATDVYGKVDIGGVTSRVVAIEVTAPALHTMVPIDDDREFLVEPEPEPEPGPAPAP